MVNRAPRWTSRCSSSSRRCHTTDGSSAAAVHNADYTAATPDRPLVPGEFAFVYAAGLGRAGNEPATGAAAPQSPLAALPGGVQVSLAGLPCEVPYAGLAPALVGVYQVNFRVPPGVPGGMLELRITAGTTTSGAVKVTVGPMVGAGSRN